MKYIKIMLYLIGVIIICQLVSVALPKVSYSQTPIQSRTYPSCVVVNRLEGCEGNCRIIKINNGCNYDVKIKIRKVSRGFFNVCPDLQVTIKSGETEQYESYNCDFSSVRIIE